MTQFLLDLASHYGYIIVLVAVGLESTGIPLPGETTLLVGSVLAGRGNLSIVGVGIAGWCGAVLGDNLGYAVGRRWGQRIVRLPLLRRFYSAERLAVAERMFARRGWLAVFFGRFVALLRIFAGPLAGIHHMPWRHFVIANAAGAACWVTVVCVIGSLLGQNLDSAVTLLSRAGYIGLAVVLIGAVAYVIWRRRSHSRDSA